MPLFLAPRAFLATSSFLLHSTISLTCYSSEFLKRLTLVEALQSPHKDILELS